MSVTVYVEGWADVEFEMVKTYMDEVYTNLDAEDFAPEIAMGTHFLEKDTGRVYEMRRQYKEAYPEINMANSSFAQVLDLLGMHHLDLACDSLSGERLDRFSQAILKAQNGKAKARHDDEVIRDGNFYDFLPGETYFTRQLHRLMELIQFARKKGVGIYWA